MHKWQDVTCEQPKLCVKCGETEGEALGHETQEATLRHGEECTVCGKMLTPPIELTFREIPFGTPYAEVVMMLREDGIEIHDQYEKYGYYLVESHSLVDVGGLEMSIELKFTSFEDPYAPLEECVLYEASYLKTSFSSKSDWINDAMMLGEKLIAIYGKVDKGGNVKNKWDSKAKEWSDSYEAAYHWEFPDYIIRESGTYGSKYGSKDELRITYRWITGENQQISNRDRQNEDRHNLTEPTEPNFNGL